MKRNFFKALLSLICVLALLFTFSVGVLAEEAALPEEERAATDNDNRENSAPAYEETPFGQVYNLIIENSDKLLSLLSFVGTLLIALIYKKGLMPGLKKVTASVTDALGAIKKEAEKTELTASECQDELKVLSKTTEGLRSDFAEIENSLCPEKAKKERRVLYTLINGQIELLYDIFMSSSLPDFKKEDVGCRIAKMKEVLKDEETITK